jgi:hypothetical protein
MNLFQKHFLDYAERFEVIFFLNLQIQKDLQ